MAAATKYAPAAAATTGNNTGAAVELTNVVEQAQVGIQFVVEVAGGSPTVTWKVQGSFDNSNWYDMLYVTDASDTATAATRTATAVGAQAEWLDTANGARLYRYYRLVTTLNTNITYRCELYAFNIPR